jgi:hypothetical protein
MISVATNKEIMNICVELIREIYKLHGVGGDLHIVLDDDNVETEWIADCLLRIDAKKKGTLERLERACAELMLCMTTAERMVCIRSYWWNKDIDSVIKIMIDESEEDK